jgi:hypothetical protein
MDLYRRRISEGRCANCGARPPRPGRLTCAECRETQRKIYLKKRGKGVRNRDDIVADPDTHRRASTKYRNKNREECIKRAKLCQREIKQIVVNNYGGKCDCCGETHIEFLTLDHINNDGPAHRDAVTNGNPGRFYSAVIKLGFPNTLRLLCMNCNWGRRYGHTCPHELDRKKHNCAGDYSI